jgi:hypothetical protein
MNGATAINVRDLERTLDLEPGLTLHALADAHEEAGADALAGAYRWLAAHNKRPAWNARRGLWWWRTDAFPNEWRGTGVVGAGGRVPFSHSLPDAAYRGLEACPGTVGCRPYEFTTCSAAYRAAARVIAGLVRSGAWREGVGHG